jgi:hypothetical protein
MGWGERSGLAGPSPGTGGTHKARAACLICNMFSLLPKKEKEKKTKKKVVSN